MVAQGCRVYGSMSMGWDVVCGSWAQVQVLDWEVHYMYMFHVTCCTWLHCTWLQVAHGCIAHGCRLMSRWADELMNSMLRGQGCEFQVHGASRAGCIGSKVTGCGVGSCCHSHSHRHGPGLGRRSFRRRSSTFSLRCLVECWIVLDTMCVYKCFSDNRRKLMF